MRYFRNSENLMRPPPFVRTPIRVKPGLSGQGVSHAETLRVSRAGTSFALAGQRRVRQRAPRQASIVA